MYSGQTIFCFGQGSAKDLSYKATFFIYKIIIKTLPLLPFICAIS